MTGRPRTRAGTPVTDSAVLRNISPTPSWELDEALALADRALCEQDSVAGVVLALVAIWLEMRTSRKDTGPAVAVTAKVRARAA